MKMDIVITLLGIIPVILAVGLILLVIKRNILERGESKPVDIVGVVPAFIILMVATLLVTGLSSDLEDRDYELYDCVPLAAFGSEAVLEGDCIETVTIGGTEYVRMTDLGTFTATIGEDSKEYTVNKAKMDLIVWAGQSNSMTYTNPSYYSGETTIEPGKGFYLGSTTPDVYFAGITREETYSTATICDIVSDENTMNVAQMYPAFYGDYYKETGHRLITANTGIGGMWISTWDDGGRSDLFFKAVMDRLIEQCEGKIELNPVAVLWVQGESNYESPQEQYLTHFQSLLEKMEDGYYGFEFPYITASLPRVDMRSYDDMIPSALAQIQEAEDDPQFSIATSIAYRATDEQYRDGLHFTQEYYGWVGEAFARQLAELTGHAPVSETIVLTEQIGAYETLPSTVTGYGTSGEGYSLEATWSSTGSGTYSATLSNAPSGTTILDGLTATASAYSWDSATKTLTIQTDMAQSASQPWDGYTQAKGLVIADTVSSIPASAFDTLAALEYVSLPDSLETIGAGAFSVSFADYLGQPIATPSAGEYVGSGTLYKFDDSIFTYSADNAKITGLTVDAVSAKHIVLPSEKDGTRITTIYNNAFKDKTDLISVWTLPETYLTTVNAYAFQGCSALTSVSLPEMTTTDTGAFQDCVLLTSVTTDKMTTLGVSAFRGCAALVSLELPLVTTFPGSVFINCTSLETVDMASATSIGINTFFGCAALKTVSLPSVTTVSDSSFRGCFGVTSVSFGSNLDSVHASSFPQWTFYDTDGTTVLDKTVASNLAGHSFTGTASALVKQS